MCSGLAGAGPLQPGAGGKNINMPTFAAAPICLNFQFELMVMLPTKTSIQALKSFPSYLCFTLC